MTPTEDNLIGARELKTDTEERDRLAAGAAQTDAEIDREERESRSGISPIQRPGTVAQSKSDDAGASGDQKLNPEASAGKAAGEQTRNEKGQFVGKEKQQPQPQAGTQPQKPAEQQPSGQPSADGQPAAKPTKEERDRARFDRNWERLNKRSEALALRERQLEEAYRRVSPGQQYTPQPGANPNARFGYREYMDARANLLRQAQDLYRAGDTEAADQQFRLAQEAEQEAYRSQALEQEHAQRTAVEKHAELWRQNAEAILKDHPEYDDETTDEFADMAELLEDYPVLFSLPDGFPKAYEILQMRKASAETSGLREQLEKANKEVERLNKLISPHAKLEAVTHDGAEMPFDQLSPDKQRQLLEADAERADAESR